MSSLHRHAVKISQFVLINEAKHLLTAIFVAGEKSPRKYHSSIVKSLAKTGTRCIENIFLANDIELKEPDLQLKVRRRQHFQALALKDLHMIVFLGSILKDLPNGLLNRQLAEILKRVYRAEKLLRAWQQSDEVRYAKLLNASSKAGVVNEIADHAATI